MHAIRPKRSRHPALDAPLNDRAVALKYAWLHDVGIGAEAVMAPKLTKIIFQTEQHDGNLARQGMCAHQVEHA